VPIITYPGFFYYDSHALKKKKKKRGGGNLKTREGWPENDSEMHYGESDYLQTPLFAAVEVSMIDPMFSNASLCAICQTSRSSHETDIVANCAFRKAVMPVI
jgi:hypothetical protein